MPSRLCAVLSLVGALLTGKAKVRVVNLRRGPYGSRRLPSGELSFGPGRVTPVAHPRDEDVDLDFGRE